MREHLIKRNRGHPQGVKREVEDNPGTAVRCGEGDEAVMVMGRGGGEIVFKDELGSACDQSIYFLIREPLIMEGTIDSSFLLSKTMIEGEANATCLEHLIEGVEGRVEVIQEREVAQRFRVAEHRSAGIFCGVGQWLGVDVGRLRLVSHLL